MLDTHTRRCIFVAAVALSLLSAAGCGGHGARVKHGNIEVFYVDGTTQAEAYRLGAYLLETWDAGADGRRSVQLKKTTDGFQFRMVVKKEFQIDDKALRKLEVHAAKISRDVLDGAAVEVHACDEHLQTLKVYPPRPDVRYGIVEGMAEVFYAATADKEDADRLAKYLGKKVADAPAQVTFKLARRDAIVEVHMVTNQDLLKDPQIIAGLRNERKDIAANVFPGATVELHLCDPLLNVLQILEP